MPTQPWDRGSASCPLRLPVPASLCSSAGSYPFCVFLSHTHTHTHTHTSGLESQPGGREAAGLTWVLTGSLILKNLQRSVCVCVCVRACMHAGDWCARICMRTFAYKPA